eukprot:GHVT01041503.1.p1 GENE.GHVT01041503.1~~GHVT01041503.1.p1  ORF type:complete len:167 (-),score=16.98 GHVT01041503.1:870-1370(-)
MEGSYGDVGVDSLASNFSTSSETLDWPQETNSSAGGTDELPAEVRVCDEVLTDLHLAEERPVDALENTARDDVDARQTAKDLITAQDRSPLFDRLPTLLRLEVTNPHMLFDHPTELQRMAAGELVALVNAFRQCHNYSTGIVARYKLQFGAGLQPLYHGGSVRHST